MKENLNNAICTEMCPICSNKLSLLFRKQKDINFKITEKKFDWFQCDFCKSICIKPNESIEEIMEYYKNYEPHNWQPTCIPIKKKFHPFFDIYSLIQKYSKDKRDIKILDFGCGSGGMLYNLSHIFNEIMFFGVDINIESAKKNLVNQKNIQLFQGELKNWKLNEKFDIIYSAQVMEHIQDPKEIVNFAEKKLKIGGLFILDIPNIDSFSFHKYQNYWVNLDTPRHRIHYSDKGLNILFNNFNTFDKRVYGYSQDIVNSIHLKNIMKLTNVNKFTRVFIKILSLLRIIKLDDRVLIAYIKNKKDNEFV